MLDTWICSAHTLQASQYRRSGQCYIQECNIFDFVQLSSFYRSEYGSAIDDVSRSPLLGQLITMWKCDAVYKLQTVG